MRCHLVSVFSVLAAGILHGLATPLAAHWSNMRIKHDWGVVPANWVCLGYPSAGTTIDLRIALRPRRKSALIDALYEVSDTRHTKYGAHLSKEQVAELVAPHPDTLEVIHSWLKHHSVPSSSISKTHGGSWLTVSGVPVSQANELLGASYQLYRHAGTNNTILRTVRYALPEALHTHVQTVSPTTHFASTHMLQQTPRTHSGAAASGEHMNMLLRRERATPSFLRWLYKTEGYEPAATGQNVLGVTGYLGQYPSPSDLKIFMNKFRADGADATFTVLQVNDGGYDAYEPGTEANLNIQYTQGLAYPVQHIFYSTGGSPPFKPDSNTPTNTNEPYLDWLNYVLDQEPIPPTITTSYGSPEQTVPQDYATSVCDLFAQLGLRGVSILFASGDHGVGEGDCMANDGSGKVRFLPIFPASCPWVTSVGGTMNDSPELAARFSGGGFSIYFPRPDYQDDEEDGTDGPVSIFLKQLGDEHHANLYNPKGRGIPDIAAQAFNFPIILKGEYRPIAGTSCAAPTAAGVISLLNDYLIRNGRRPLGFLNPWLYGRGRPGLTDITSGSNTGCDTDGFSAVPGWDPVTGFGTPNFEALLKILNKPTAQSSGNPTSDN